MADRVNVTLSMLMDDFQENQAKAWFDTPDSFEHVGTSRPSRGNLNLTDRDPRVELEYQQVGGGVLPFLPLLREKAIPYTASWEQGAQFAMGSEFCRFTVDGELKHFSVYSDEINPPLHELKARLTKPLQLVEYIKQYERERTPLPWTNQGEYAKRYLTLQLLKPKE
jgi:hypothetical protein